MRCIPRLRDRDCIFFSYGVREVFELLSDMAKKKNKMRGSKSEDTLTGTSGKDVVIAKGGDDTITTYEGKDKIKAGGGNDTIASGTGLDKVWGGEGQDLFVTENGSPNNVKKGHMKIMDFEVGDKIKFCGCASAKLEQRGKNVWLIKGDDVKAVIKGVDAEDLEINYSDKLVMFASDPLA